MQDQGFGADHELSTQAGVARCMTRPYGGGDPYAPLAARTHVFEIVAMLLVAIQLIAGRDHIWLPERWRRLPLASPAKQRFIDRLIRVIRWLERFSRPRATFLFDHRLSNIVFGALVLAGSLAAFLAPPFSGLDTLPSLGVVLLSLGVVLRGSRDRGALRSSWASPACFSSSSSDERSWTASGTSSRASQQACGPGPSLRPGPGSRSRWRRRSGLALRRLHALEEEIRVAAEVVGRRQRYRVDAVLDNGVTGGGETGDSLGERADEATELVGRQGSIDPAVALRQISVVVVRAEHDLERPRAAHQAREVLRRTPARDQAERGLELAEDR